MADFKSIHKRPTHSGSKDRTPVGLRIRSPVFELFALHHKRSLGIGKARHLNPSGKVPGRPLVYKYISGVRIKSGKRKPVTTIHFV